MRFLGFIISAAITIALVVLLNDSIGKIPPPGKFFSPFTGFWQNEETSKASYEKLRHFDGLNDEVKVLIDDQHIPHIFAKNDEDLYFMQGYVTARDRLWQMEFIIFAASGRLSEIVGMNEAVLERDRMQRRLGIPYAAKNAIALLDTDPVAKTTLTAYSAGVNAYINSLDYKDLPIEYKLLDYRPEEWKPYNSAILLKFMAQDLTGHDHDFERSNALKLLGRKDFDLLFPDFPKGIDPIIPVGTPFNFGDNAPKDTASVIDISKPLSYSPWEKPEPNIGSNNWAISGTKSKTGYPVLCNDPHLGLRIPAIWYQSQLHSPDVDVYGVSIPGSPGITIGFNENIAWGVTNAGMDVKDWYRIEYDDDSRREKYKYDGQWLPVKKVIEEIKIRGREPFYDTVAYTDFGPVVYDRSFEYYDNEMPLALRWTAHDASNELKTFYLLNRAKNYDDYLAALDYYECPGQNFVFASKQGNIAIKEQGKFVLKEYEQGKFVQDGTTSTTAWHDFIPFENNPHIKNPERGFVSSANQHPTDTTYPYYYNGHYEYYRNRRINQQLRSKDKLSIEDNKRLQTDNFNLLASEILPYLLTQLNPETLSETEQKAFDILADWKYYDDKDLEGPTVFELFWENLNRLLWDEFQLANAEIDPPNNYNTVSFLINHPDHPLVDNKATKEIEDVKAITQNAFKKAVADLTHWSDSSGRSWEWAGYKGTRLAHWIPTLKPFYIRDIPIGGDKHIVNATSKTHGASWRMVVSLGPEFEAWGIYPGGQSGNPGSPYYANFVETWAKGEYHPLLFLDNPDTTDKRIVFTQTFNP